jgi:pimeloyl-ACP methyl ester carboxylesterase
MTPLDEGGRPMIETDVTAADGRVLHAYDTGHQGDERLVVFWHHGTPNIGTPPEPLFAASEPLGIRWISYDRPGYGGSTRQPGRTTASVAADAVAVADALGVGTFAVMGYSGGATFALASAALLPERVVAAVGFSPLAPFRADGLDWFTGMGPSGLASLTAATLGLTAKESFEATNDDEPDFVPADLDVLTGDWGWLGTVAGPAMAGGPGGLIDDDIAYVSAWGTDVAQFRVPVLLAHGGRDRIVPSTHSEWLARRCPNAELRRFPEDGHLSVLRHAPDALTWLAARVTAH